MSDEPRRAPREISEAQAFEILAAAEAEIPERVRGFLRALADLELETLLCTSCEAKLNLAERSARGEASYGFTPSPLLAGAILSRLRGVLAPVLALSPAAVEHFAGLEAELRKLAERTA